MGTFQTVVLPFTQMAEAPIYAVGLRVGMLSSVCVSAITHPGALYLTSVDDRGQRTC
jgi:hypothetical protein